MNIISRLRRFHRWHALVMSMVVLMAAGSGLLHTWMARTQPPPPPAHAVEEIPLAAVAIGPRELPAGAYAAVGLRTIDGAPWWQLLPAAGGRPRWIDARDGHEDAQADARYAAGIASRFLGGAAVRETALLTAYDDEYIAIFRLLPVHRFAADDGRGTRVYVSTITGSVTRHTDDGRQWEADAFSMLHKWMFIHQRSVRDWVLMAAMSSVMLLAVSGVALFLLTGWAARRQRA